MEENLNLGHITLAGARHEPFTRKGDMSGIKATDKQIEIPGVEVTRIINGKIKKERGYFNIANLMKQLGVSF